MSAGTHLACLLGAAGNAAGLADAAGRAEVGAIEGPVDLEGTVDLDCTVKLGGPVGLEGPATGVQAVVDWYGPTDPLSTFLIQSPPGIPAELSKVTSAIQLMVASPVTGSGAEIG